MISVVMATFNGARYIEEQLTSIFNQTLRPDEIIVVDDKSNDSTLGIVKKFLDKGIVIKIIENTSNLGPALTFAKGILCSSGEIIFLCDQDDIWHENKIRIMSDILKKNPNVKVLCTNYEKYIERKGGVEKKKKFTNQLYQVALETVLMGNVSPGCTMCIRNTYRDKANLINENIFIHDWFYTVLGAMENGLYYLDMPLIIYRIHDSNTLGSEKTFLPKYKIPKRITYLERHGNFYNEMRLISESISRDLFKHNVNKELTRYSKICLNRILAIKNELNFFKFIIFYISNKKYIKWSSILGDIYFCLKNKR